MKAIKAIEIYSLTLPARQNTLSFFESPTYQTHYFRSQEDAILYQKAYCPELALDKDVKIAVEDKDKQGNNRWVIVRKTEDMENSNHNKMTDRSNYYRHTISFANTPILEQAIQDNPSSVFLVKECKRNEWESGGQFGGPSSTTIVYDISDEVTKDTRFLYVSGREKWFVERDRKITLADVSELKLQSDIEANQERLQELMAEQNRLQQEQQSLLTRKKM